MKNRNFQKPRFLKTVSFLRPNFSEKPYIPKTMVCTSYFLIRIFPKTAIYKNHLFPKTVISENRNFRKTAITKTAFSKNCLLVRPNFSEKPYILKTVVRTS